MSPVLSSWPLLSRAESSQPRYVLYRRAQAGKRPLKCPCAATCTHSPDGINRIALSQTRVIRATQITLPHPMAWRWPGDMFRSLK